MSALSLAAQESTAAAQSSKDSTERTLYRIRLALDFDNRTFTGTERVRWVNDNDKPASVLYFHLYSNVRAGSAVRPSGAAASGADNPATQDEPHLEVTEVRSASNNSALFFSLDDQGTTLRVNLRTAVQPAATSEIEITFKGNVPEIDAEETGLVVHVLQQVGAALRSEREVRRARDLNFRCRGVMMLGTFYPVLAAREGDDWQRKVETTIGDMVFTETADYRVTIEAPGDVALYTSAPSAAARADSTNTNAREFAGENLRDFAVVAGRNLRAAERTVGDVKVRSIFMAEHETVGRRVLNDAASATQVYLARFGPLPYKTLNIVDVPLVAGLGNAEFTGLGAIASAFYVDFDSPTMRNLPEIIREQRASVEDSLEWTVAHTVAHQWWGAAVGNDPERDPVLDEALANFSALLYFKEARGEERARAALEDQLRGVYKVYRTFGGEDMAADRSAREYRNFFQYAAIVSSKGALMFTELGRQLGEEKFFAALRSYYRANLFEIAGMDDLRGAFIGEAPLTERRVIARTFNRWLSSRRGDEDISPPDPQLAEALGINSPAAKGNDRNAFARLGKFFWQQMTRIR